ncbi:MAG: methyltransferase domain-containing protein [Candidatus Cloacimonetes bacterium]|nr:methyltransferase domain-containing protein [Candidatus Cloacimonadota bacterium]
MTNNSKQTKLHLGCGSRFIPGYVHVDVIHHPHIDYLCNIDDLSVFHDNSVDVIYNCHVLEHFHRYKVGNVLKEWFRVLKPGGILRTSVPDFAALAELYLKTKDLKTVVGPIMGRQNYLYNIHYNIFDYTYFHDLLEQVGFKTINRYDWKDTEHANIDDYSQAYYPHMDKENGLLLSLNVEATK